MKLRWYDYVFVVALLIIASTAAWGQAEEPICVPEAPALKLKAILDDIAREYPIGSPERQALAAAWFGMESFRASKEDLCSVVAEKDGQINALHEVIDLKEKYVALLEDNLAAANKDTDTLARMYEECENRTCLGRFGWFGGGGVTYDLDPDGRRLSGGICGGWGIRLGGKK